jgi:hypothetical protein
MSNSTSDAFDQRLAEEKKLYESFTTFEQLCSYGAGFCNDEYKYMPSYYASETLLNIFEHNDDNGGV